MFIDSLRRGAHTSSQTVIHRERVPAIEQNFEMSPTIFILLVLAVQHGATLFLPDSPELRRLLDRYQDEMEHNRTSAIRTRRAIPWSDREEILNLHNKLRGQVYPTASNMEYMVWDDELERSATHWAEQCVWDHGPHDLLMSIGQNLAVHWGRYRSPAYHVQAWYDEVKDYTYPYPHECNPWCPERCSGPMCTHYTQLVWATTNRVGCAVHVCPRMNVWGEIWENSVYLVCNYSPKGNWIGEAPYLHGRPCSQCPPSYGGVCRDNLCYKGEQPSWRPETEDMNEVEKPQVPVQDHTTTTKPAPKPKPRPTAPKKPSKPKTHGSIYLAQNINCDTKMREKCRGATCNRYKCPANCQNSKGKVYGTNYFDVVRVINNNGGLVDITRHDDFPFFDKDTRNGIETFRAALRKSLRNTRRNALRDVKAAPVALSPSSSICRAAIHAGVIKASGGYVDVLAMKKKPNYVGAVKNGIKSERCLPPLLHIHVYCCMLFRRTHALWSGTRQHVLKGQSIRNQLA
ncbi:cysteine-rich secretory protein LCCL domain-containing 2-like, partial [Scleropages formosus]